MPKTVSINEKHYLEYITLPCKRCINYFFLAWRNDVNQFDFYKSNLDFVIIHLCYTCVFEMYTKSSCYYRSLKYCAGIWTIIILYWYPCSSL